MKKRYNVGDVVKISPSAPLKYKDQSGMMNGVIAGIMKTLHLDDSKIHPNEYYYHVNWANNKSNYYRAKDLVFVCDNNRDLELINEKLETSSKEKIPRFKIGDSVKVIAETNGWGKVNYGEIGIVRSVDHFREDDNYIVDFPSQSFWSGQSSCFSLVEDNSVQDEIVYSPSKVIIENTPLVRVITTNGISSEFKNEQSINLSIYKPKKVKQLKL
jgi:hypothetical protein